MSKTVILGLAALVPAGLLAGCAAQQAWYRPSEPTTYAMGHPATSYEVTLDSQRLGIVKVYSEGGYTNSNTSRPVIDVRMRIRNLSDGPISLDLGRCDVDLDTDQAEQVLEQPQRADGVEPIPPGGVRQIVLEYPLQNGLRPEDVNGFDFDWTLQTDRGSYANTTPFVRHVQENEYAYYPVYTWAHPWPYPYGYWGYPYGLYGPYYSYGFYGRYYPYYPYGAYYHYGYYGGVRHGDRLPREYGGRHDWDRGESGRSYGGRGGATRGGAQGRSSRGGERR